MSETNKPIIPHALWGKGINVNRTYSFISNAGFYALVNRNYYDYYNEVVRYLAQWLDGYVYDFHSPINGILSTRIASSIVKGISNNIVGKQLLFKGTDDKSRESLTAINEWTYKSDFQNAVRLLVNFAVGLGTSAFKINSTGSNLWCEALRLDQFTFEVDARGNLSEFTCMIKKYANTAQKVEDKTVANYYLAEHRFFKDAVTKKTELVDGQILTFEYATRIPYVKYTVHKTTGNVRNNVDVNMTDSGEIRWDSLPGNIRKAIKRDFGVIKIDEAQKLPFNEWLGVELYKFGVGDISLPNIPFGTSILQNIVAYLMLYDLSWSYSCRDMYFGKGMVLVPKSMQMPGKDKYGQQPIMRAFDESIFTEFATTDPDKQKPENIQFELRGEQWSQIQDNILKKIATTIGMSPRTLASYLGADGAQKTATEIDAENDATLSFIDFERNNLGNVLDRILEHVLNFLGKSNNVSVQFATPAIVNMDKIIERAMALKQAGLIDLKEAVKMCFPDEDEDKIAERVKAIQEEEASRLSQETELNPFNM